MYKKLILLIILVLVMPTALFGMVSKKRKRQTDLSEENRSVRARIDHNSSNAMDESEDSPPEIRDNDGNTDLMLAADDGQSDKVAELIKKGADVNATNNQAYTALMLAAISGHNKIIQQLLDAKANAHGTNNHGSTALHLAVAESTITKATVLSLLKASWAINKQDIDGITPIMAAAQAGNEEIVKLLIGLGASINTLKDKNGDMVLMRAVKHNQYEIVDALLKHVPTALINIRDSNGYTPLMVAASKGNELIMSALLRYGADPSMEIIDKATGKALTAYDIAQKYKHQEWLEQFNHATVGYDKRAILLKQAIENNDIITAQELISQGTPLQSKTENLMYLAATRHRENIVALMLKAGAECYEALCSAAKYNDKEALELLIKSGADINQVGKDGAAVIHYAAGMGNRLQILKVLCNVRVNVNQPTRDNRLAIEYALISGDLEVIKFLFSVGAILPQNQKNVLERISNEGHVDVIEYLVRQRIITCDKDTYEALIVSAKNSQQENGQKIAKEQSSKLDSSKAQALTNKLFYSKLPRDVMQKVVQYLDTKEQIALLSILKLSQTDKFYTCNLCNFVTSTSQNLRMHTKTHSGEKPFHCEYEGCTFTASSKASLIKHQQVHHERSKKSSSAIVKMLIDRGNSKDKK